MSCIPLEEMDHLADAFRKDVAHHRQQGQPIEVKLMYVVTLYPYQEGYSEDAHCKLISVKIPKNLPISEVRLLTADVERQLSKLFNSVKRLHFVRVRYQGADYWQTEYSIPWKGLVYA
jgi:hypothetical protein